MDPDTALARALEIIRRDGPDVDDRDELVETLRNLADWIERGGFLPRKAARALGIDR